MNKRICYFSIDLSNPFGETLLSSVYKRVHDYGDKLFVVHGGILNSPHEWEVRRNSLYGYIDPDDYDGFIISSILSFSSYEDSRKFVLPYSRKPLIIIGEKIDSIPFVGVDNSAGFKDLIEHIIDQSVTKKIAVIAGPVNNYDSSERFNVLRKVMASRQINLPDENIYFAIFSADSAIEGVRVLLDERKINFDSLICFNDRMAIGAMGELKRRGYRIPEDIRLSGFDNTYESEFMTPPLTTVSYPIEKVGIAAVDGIEAILAGKKIDKPAIFPTQFIKRRSSGSMELHDFDFFGYDISSYFTDESEIDLEYYISFADKLLTFEKYESDYRENIKKRLYLFFSEIDLSKMSIINIILKFEFMIVSNYSEENDLRFLKKYFFYLYQIAEKKNKKVISDILFFLSGYCRSKILSIAVKDAILGRTEEEYLIQIGEDLSSSYDIQSIRKSLSTYCKYIGIETLFVVVYDEEHRDKAYLSVRIENQQNLPVDDSKSYPAKDILPEELKNKYHELLLDALCLADDDIGYVLYNLGNHPNILYKSLRKHISGAIKGNSLLRKINNYSSNLEKLISERTQKLISVNENLVEEIKRREAAENELIKKRNLDSLALLAGGIAHDFNNILTAIGGNVNLLQMRKDQSILKNEILLNQVLSAVDKAKNLTQQLLTFSKGGHPVKKTQHIKPLVEESAKFILAGSNAKPKFNFIVEDVIVDMDSGQINQVLNNVILNAVHSMPGGGEIGIILDVYETESENEYDLSPGSYVRISISDSGCGIPENIVHRIFDPYFTTKEKGSGLGLSTSIAIVKKHGGNIIVKSVLNKGTVFNIFLPVSKGTVDVSETVHDKSLPSGMSFLVLEDDPDIQKLIINFLHNLGQKCDIVSEGSVALEFYLKSKYSGKYYDAVILDLTIPGGMGGKDVMDKILEINPEAAGIVSSGYSDDPVISEYRKFGFKAILRKPYLISDLKNAIIESLDIK
ncbi:MAG: substrate-binding domain-containing protein [Spirochaetes bacterium]|nr:substrate-binding domain-containing protein [Spirochaetota bacterium]